MLRNLDVGDRLVGGGDAEIRSAISMCGDGYRRILEDDSESHSQSSVPFEQRELFEENACSIIELRVCGDIREKVDKMMEVREPELELQSKPKPPRRSRCTRRETKIQARRERQ